MPWVRCLRAEPYSENVARIVTETKVVFVDAYKR